MEVGLSTFLVEAEDRLNRHKIAVPELMLDSSERIKSLFERYRSHFQQ